MKKFAATLIIAALGYSAYAHACTAFYESETIDGLYKICYYDHLGSTVAVTVKSHELCKLNINVRH